MKKLKSKSKKVSVLSTKTFTDKLIYLAILLLSIVVIIQGYYLIQMHQWNKIDSVISTKALIVNALDNLYQLGTNNVAYNYESGRVLIPEQRLVLPIDYNHKGISAQYYYEYDENGVAIPNSSNQIDLTDYKAYMEGQYNLEPTTQEILFNSVPMAQACTRQAILYFSNTPSEYRDTESYSFVFSKTLTDGRQIEAYKSKVCTDGADEFVDYLRQIDSY